MRVPRHRQEWGEFERTIENKKLVIWGRSRSCIEICRKYPVAYIVDNNDELCDIHVENREICLPDRLYLCPRKVLQGNFQQPGRNRDS